MCENDKVLKVQRVSYPGTRYTCADKKGDLVYNSMGDVERECVLANDNNGMSEYECVLKCQSDAKLDKDCSKECLPELWVWNKIKVGNEVVGYYQTGDLAQYADTSYSLSTCNPYKVSDVTMNIIDCEECTDCKWVKNGETYDYQCTKCDRCNGGDNDAYCKGGTCRNCDLSGRCKSCSSITDCGKYSRNEKTGCTMGLYNKGENYNPSQIKVPPGNEALCIRYKGTTCDNGITKDGGVLGKTWWGTTTLINY
jgi:hypothetical protein